MVMENKCKPFTFIKWLGTINAKNTKACVNSFGPEKLIK